MLARLGIMRVRFSRRLSPLAVFYTILRPLAPCNFHLSFVIFAFTFRKAFPKCFDKLYLWSNVCIEAVDRNEKEVIFVLR